MIYTDEQGCNVDPTKCDCGKGYYCPLWNDEWAEFYGLDLQDMTKLQEWAEVHEKPEVIYSRSHLYVHPTKFLEAWVERTNNRLEYFRNRSK